MVGENRNGISPMAEHSNIEWTDATWQPITGCSVVSPGCTNCYAMRIAGTRLQHHPSRANLTTMTKAGPVWNGAVRFNREWLTQPLGWKKPRRIFVCAHGDLFHESVPDEWIDKIFAVMALTPQHTYQVLTKRSARMRAYMNGLPSKIPFLGRMPLERVHLEAAGHMEGDGGYMDALKKAGNVYSLYLDAPWPLPNVWLGVSSERQKEADERIPDLLATPADLRFISAEPLLGGLEIAKYLRPCCDRCPPWETPCRIGCSNVSRLDWAIVGGESGSGARPMHPDWARSLRDQCAAAGVPFFFKQWGAWMPTSSVDVYCHGPDRDKRRYPNSGGVAMLADGRICLRDFTVAQHAERIGTGIAGNSRAIEVDRAALADFHTSIVDEGRAQDNPLGLQWMYAVGKKAAGRLLDGVAHDATPDVAR